MILVVVGEKLHKEDEKVVGELRAKRHGADKPSRIRLIISH